MAGVRCGVSAESAVGQDSSSHSGGFQSRRARSGMSAAMESSKNLIQKGMTQVEHSIYE